MRSAQPAQKPNDASIQRAFIRSFAQLEELKLQIAARPPRAAGRSKGETRIAKAFSEIRALAGQYKLRALATAPLSELRDKIERRPKLKISLDTAIEAYQKLAGKDFRQRPFVSARELGEKYCKLNQNAGFTGLDISACEVFALLHKEGFLEKLGRHSKSHYRLAPNVSRLRL